MGTPATIFFPVADNESGYRGISVNYDGYISGVGKELWEAYHGPFKRDTGKLRHYLLEREEASEGWSSISGLAAGQEPGWGRHYSDPNQPESYWCRGERDNDPFIESLDRQWGHSYIVRPEGLEISEIDALVVWGGPEPNWKLLEERGEDW